VKDITVFFANIFNNISTFYTKLDTEEKVLFYLVVSLIILILFLVGFLERRLKIIRSKSESLKEKRQQLLETKKQRELIETAVEEKLELPEPMEDSSFSDDNKIDLEKIKKQLEEDAKTKTINFTSFEKSQEENSIISYAELKKKAEQEKPVSLNDVVEQIQQRNQVEPEKKEELYTEKKTPYKPMPFISPVFGIEKEEQTTEIKKEPEKPKSLEETLDLTPISEEIKKNDDFLEALKDFRKNLD
jgi:hypothetical protein